MNALVLVIQESILTNSPYKHKRSWHLVQKWLAYSLVYVPLAWYYQQSRKQRTFIPTGREYHATWRNERAVVIIGTMGGL